MRPSREHATRNEQTYFVTSDTWSRRQLFRNERWAKLLMDTLYHYRGHAYLLHEFVVMPDHFHVLITPATSLEKAVQFIKGGFSHRAKVELGSNMEVWQKGFSDHQIRDAEDYANHVGYIHQNPVRMGISASADEYAYSSAHEWFERDPVPQRLKPLASAVLVGAAEAAPFQNRGSASNEDYAAVSRNEPQELKPDSSASDHGAAKAAPFQSNAQGLKPAQSAGADGTPECVPFRSKIKLHG